MEDFIKIYPKNAFSDIFLYKAFKILPYQGSDEPLVINPTGALILIKEN